MEIPRRHVRAERARLKGQVGAVYGKLYQLLQDRPERDFTPDLIEISIEYSRIAYDELKKLKQTEDTPAAANNLAYYLALRGGRGDADTALKLAAEIRDLYILRGNPEIATTYGRVIAKFAECSKRESPTSLIEEAIFLTDDLIAAERTRISPYHKKNAQRNKILLEESLARVKGKEHHEPSLDLVRKLGKSLMRDLGSLFGKSST